MSSVEHSLSPETEGQKQTHRFPARAEGIPREYVDRNYEALPPEYNFAIDASAVPPQGIEASGFGNVWLHGVNKESGSGQPFTLGLPSGETIKGVPLAAFEYEDADFPDSNARLYLLDVRGEPKDASARYCVTETNGIPSPVDRAPHLEGQAGEAADYALVKILPEAAAYRTQVYGMVNRPGMRGFSNGELLGPGGAVGFSEDGQSLIVHIPENGRVTAKSAPHEPQAPEDYWRMGQGEHRLDIAA